MGPALTASDSTTVESAPNTQATAYPLQQSANLTPCPSGPQKTLATTAPPAQGEPGESRNPELCLNAPHPRYPGLNYPSISPSVATDRVRAI